MFRGETQTLGADGDLDLVAFFAVFQVTCRKELNTINSKYSFNRIHYFAIGIVQRANKIG